VQDSAVSEAVNRLQFFHLGRTVRVNDSKSKHSGKEEKCLLTDISGNIKSGKVLGIMGPSGAGELQKGLLSIASEKDSILSMVLLLH
jgi:ABC-type protease/lipase transport system fused ATPase/permease subunit